jgi:Tfp pilus assembly protein PilO
MVLSKRERMILIAAIIAVVMLVADRFVVGPVSARREEIKARKLELQAELESAQLLFTRQKLMERKWKTLLSDGLRNDAEAESKIARALDEWSKEAMLTLSSVKPERVASDKGLKEMTFVVAGMGTLEAVSRFLWQIETAPMPIKVMDMQVGSTNETGQSMSLQLRLSALCLGSEQKPSQNERQEEQQEMNNEETL